VVEVGREEGAVGVVALEEEALREAERRSVGELGAAEMERDEDVRRCRAQCSRRT